MTKKWNPSKPILGYTDRDTVKLDFDNVPFKTVKSLALWTVRKFRLKGFIIPKSSPNHYHIVFDASVTWEDNVSIISSVCLASKSESLLKWFLLQSRKKKSTLRGSPKGDKPSPRIVFSYGKQDNEIKNYLRYRRLIKNTIKKILTS